MITTQQLRASAKSQVFDSKPRTSKSRLLDPKPPIQESKSRIFTSSKIRDLTQIQTTTLFLLLTGFLSLSLLLQTAPAYAGLNDGLVAYYPFNGNANDEIGNGNHGTIYNAVFVQGISGNGLQFTGNFDSYVEVPNSDSLSPTEAVTVSLWAKESSPSPAYSSMIYKAGEEPIGWCGDRQYSLWTTSSQGIHLTSTPEGSTDQITCNSSNGAYGLGDFFHVVGVINTSDHTMKIYVNGIKVQECPYSGDQIRDGNYPLRIGGHFHYGGDQYNFNGVIDEVRIYNRALSDAEIQELYNESPQPTCNPPSYIYPDSSKACGVYEAILDNPSYGNHTTVNINIQGTPLFVGKSFQYWMSVTDVYNSNPEAVPHIGPNNDDPLGAFFASRYLIPPSSHASFRVEFCKPGSIRYTIASDARSSAMSIIDMLITAMGVDANYDKLFGILDDLLEIPTFKAAATHFAKSLNLAMAGKEQDALREIRGSAKSLIIMAVDKSSRIKLYNIFKRQGIELTITKLLTALLKVPTQLLLDAADSFIYLGNMVNGNLPMQIEINAN